MLTSGLNCPKRGIARNGDNKGYCSPISLCPIEREWVPRLKALALLLAFYGYMTQWVQIPTLFFQGKEVTAH